MASELVAFEKYAEAESLLFRHLGSAVLGGAATRTHSEADALFLRLLGVVAFRLGKPDAAERAYRVLLDVMPDDVTGLFHLGLLTLDRGLSPMPLRHWAGLSTFSLTMPRRAVSWPMP